MVSRGGWPGTKVPLWHGVVPLKHVQHYITLHYRYTDHLHTPSPSPPPAELGPLSPSPVLLTAHAPNTLFAQELHKNIPSNYRRTHASEITNEALGNSVKSQLPDAIKVTGENITLDSRHLKGYRQRKRTSKKKTNDFLSWF